MGFQERAIGAHFAVVIGVIEQAVQPAAHQGDLGGQGGVHRRQGEHGAHHHHQGGQRRCHPAQHFSPVDAAHLPQGLFHPVVQPGRDGDLDVAQFFLHKGSSFNKVRSSWMARRRYTETVPWGIPVAELISRMVHPSKYFSFTTSRYFSGS